MEAQKAREAAKKKEEAREASKAIILPAHSYTLI